ncbi:MAG: CCA tRNA nucleotidyltransferase [Actinomycetota bacterium]|nr:CCA tRNA nucleotidyltransferase [Actinomycetota bacterium]
MSKPLGRSARVAFDELLKPGSPVLGLAERFRAASQELFLVGGTVRDAFLGRPQEDLDFATDAPPERTLELVQPEAEATWLQGMKFGTVGARISGLHMEITTFRTETYAPESRHPDVAFAPSIDSDLSRRDFTVNAMALRLPEKEAVDPFGGLKDLDARLLRTPIEPSDSFTDDPLRMLRAFRFASQLDFKVHDDVLAAISALRETLATVSAERIREEFTRLIMGGKPGNALQLADRTGIAELFLPELSALKLEQDPVHRHKDVFLHTLAVVERTRQDEELRVAALLHDIGKPKTRRIESGGVTFHHHEVVGAEMAEKRLRALRYPNETVLAVKELIRLHHRFHTYRLGWTDSAIRRYVRDAGPLLGKLNELVRADCTTQNPAKARELAGRMDELEERIKLLAEQEELARIRPELDGIQVMAYIGKEPGPVVGEALRHLLEVRLDEGILGEEVAYQRLDAWARDRGLDPPGLRVPPKEEKSDEPAGP